MVPVALQDAKAARPPTMRTLLRFLRWMIHTDPRYSIVLLVLQFATGLLPAASIWIMRALFDRSLAVYEGNLPVEDMLVWIALWIVLALAHVVFSLELFFLLVDRLKQELEDRLLTQLQHKASVLRLETFERADFHDVLRRAQEAASPGFFLNLIGEINTIITGTLTVVSVALVVGLWNPLLLIAIALVSIPPPLARVLQEKNTFYLKREQTQRERLRAYLERILTERAAAKEVRVFNLGTALFGWWEHLYWQVADRLFQQRRSQSLVNILLAAFSLTGLAAGIGWSAWAVANGGLSPGQFAAMMVALQQVSTHVDLVFWRFGYLANRLLYIADLFTYLDLGPEDPKEGEPIDRVGEVPIAVSSLSFRYPQAERLAIDDISFTIQPGERVALVGAN
ncbi:MAG: ABC transporter ATP-binding protein, partial [Gemmatimonadetes bacterium]|nr:ABC transporter ATP-binding protein [Gemmatimonadota bacterium]